MVSSSELVVTASRERSEEARVAGGATTAALLEADDGERRARLDPSIVDVSDGEGIPIGTLGSGHSVFGRNGFSREAFTGPLDMGPDFRTLRLPADYGFFVADGESTYALSQYLPVWRNPALPRDLITAERVLAYAELPKAHYRFEYARAELDVVMTAFSPLVAHDVETSSIPVQIFELTLRNRASRSRSLRVRLAHAEVLSVHADTACQGRRNGHVRFAALGGAADTNGVFVDLELAPGERRTVRFVIGWYFPEFKTPSPAATAIYHRFYASRFSGALDVIRLAEQKADAWSRAIDDWRASFDVPPEMKRLWFSSLSSVITSTLLGDACFFTIESPHDWVNTMDVAVYANWVYLVNWPELERTDLDQYVGAIPREGERAGFVWHSLWVDAAHYAEEPTFLTRLWRAHLWFNDRAWLERAAGVASAAANYAHEYGSFEHLLVSNGGNQSYDEWMMPGASSYVNVAWLYALHALAAIDGALGKHTLIAGTSVRDLVPVVRAKLFEHLWSEEGGYFRCFHRTSGASDASVEETVFTDQLFGAWVLLIDESSADVLPHERIASALETIYRNNLVEAASSTFRGWVNGMLPDGRPDATSGYHARTCWLGAQLDLASLLGSVGEEAKSLDVFRSIESSLSGCHLAVGEWNRAVDADGRVVILDEWGKDTPRFPPYPRYTSCWEYLIRMLGLSLSEELIYLRPFQSLRFALRGVELAGSTLTIVVEPNWSRAVVNGVEVEQPVALRRGVDRYEVRFTRE
jgi:uncharacterized protein (DUF608 family)